MARYPVLDRLNHDGKTYEPGKSVTIDDAESAEQLIELGVIGEAEKVAKVAPTQTPTPAPAPASKKRGTPATSASVAGAPTNEGEGGEGQSGS